MQPRVRNLCVLAHVDHGKTTLTDHLAAHAGLVHPRLAGEVRFMDSRDDEQARGITMKASSISMLYMPPLDKNAADGGAGQEKERGEGSDPTPPADSAAAALAATHLTPTPAAIAARGMLINLVDSPGHVDFCAEVGAAARLCDGALVVVDAVEGVRVQTHAVLRSAYDERLAMTLVVNKVDRLATELGLDVPAAAARLEAIVAHANTVVSAFASEEAISRADAVLAGADEGAAAAAAAGAGGDDDPSSSAPPAFDPASGNVAFASAADGWAFTVPDLAAAGAARLGCGAAALARAAWGPWALDAKTRRVARVKPPSARRTLFMQLGLDPVWRAYGAAGEGQGAGASLAKAATALGLDPAPIAAAAAKDARSGAKLLLKTWAPLAPAVLRMAASALPAPDAAARARVPRLLGGPPPAGLPPALAAELKLVEDAALACDSGEGAPLLASVGKVVAVPWTLLPRRTAPAPTPPPGAPPVRPPRGAHAFLAFVRVFAGVLRDGGAVCVLAPGHDPARVGAASAGADPGAPHTHPITTATIDGVYLMMGGALARVGAAPAGAVACVGGLDDAVVAAATLSSTPAARPLAPVSLQASPIVRVAVEAADPAQQPAVAAGLALLHRADPALALDILPTGEAILGAAGEVHLETAVADLRDRFAGVPLVVSPPLAAFRESVADPDEEAATAGPVAANAPPRAAPPAAKVAEATTAGGAVTLRVRAHPLTAAMAAALDGDGVRDALGGREGAAAAGARARAGAAAAASARDAALAARAWALGPRGAGPVMLLGGSADLWAVGGDGVVAATPRGGGGGGVAVPAPADPVAPTDTSGIFVRLGRPAAAAALGLAPEGGAADADPALPLALAAARADVEAGVVSGFQMAAAAGPLCDEPLWGVALEVGARLNVDARGALPPSTLAEDVYGPLSGQVSSAARAAARAAVRGAGPRIVEPTLLADVTTTADALAGVYAALGRRRARVLSEEMREGAGLFSVHARLPAQAAVGLAADLRARSSGAASASLILSHWERLCVDPFFVPVTEDEREEYGEEGQGVGAPNVARRLVDSTRARKGLPVAARVVESATKQRTRARKV